MIYLELFFGFLKVGFFSFGGGYASIALIRDVVLSYGWIGDDMMTYMIAVSESTPGPIMVNLATYVGSSQAGFAGAVIATTAAVLPSFFIIILIMIVMNRWIQNPYIQAVIGGLKPCVTGIILATGVYMIINNCLGAHGGGAVDPTALILTVVFAAVYFGSRRIPKIKISPIGLIGISAVTGILVYGWIG